MYSYIYTVGYHLQIWWNMWSYWASDVETFRYQHWSPFIANKHFEPLCTSSAKKSGQTADLEKYAGHLGRKYGSTKTNILLTLPTWSLLGYLAISDLGSIHHFCNVLATQAIWVIATVISGSHTHSHSLPDLKMIHHDSWYFAAEGTPAAGGIQPLQSI